MIWRIAAAAGALLLATTVEASAEGLLDFLFGGTAPTAQAPAEAGAITVHRRYPKPRAARKPSAAQADSGKPANLAIDPVKVADWYLKDRTLRRGDIIVLKSRVLVFMGAHGEVRAGDFAQLRDARGISAKTRAFVMKATAANAYTAEAAAPPKPEPKPRLRRAT